MSRQLIDEMDLAISQISGSEDILAVILIGEAKYFLTGAAAFSFSPVFNAIDGLSVQVVAAINGYAIGRGLELALVCDIEN